MSEGCSGLSARGVRRTPSPVFLFRDRTLPRPVPQIDPIFAPDEWQSIFRGLSLSPRQTQVIRMLFDGYCDKQIAEELGISVPTVRSHLQRLYARFRVQDRTALVIYIVAWFRQTQPSASIHPTSEPNHDIQSTTSD